MGIGAKAPAKSRSCPRHYGICVNQHYKDWKHTGEIAVRDALDGEMRVHGKLFWLIRKGDLISPGRPIAPTSEFQYQVTRQDFDLGKTMHMIFVATAAKDAPSSMSELPRGMYIFSIEPTTIP